MDLLIASLPARRDDDLMLCPSHGIAYQRRMHANRVDYNADYLEKVRAYEGGEIARRVIAGRLALMGRWLDPGASVLDYGVGSGEFLREAMAEGYAAKGFDIIPEVVSALHVERLYSDDPSQFEALTLWDTLEHLPEPWDVMGPLGVGGKLFVSIPLFEDLARIRESKHYRPGEHLYYFTRTGFVRWMRLRHFEALEESDHEREAGRESIGAFAFRRLA